MYDTGPGHRRQPAPSASGRVFENKGYDPDYDPRTNPDHPLHRGP